jgi:hypothetical protein
MHFTALYPWRQECSIMWKYTLVCFTWIHSTCLEKLSKTMNGLIEGSRIDFWIRASSGLTTGGDRQWWMSRKTSHKMAAGNQCKCINEMAAVEDVCVCVQHVNFNLAVLIWWRATWHACHLQIALTLWISAALPNYKIDPVTEVGRSQFLLKIPPNFHKLTTKSVG